MFILAILFLSFGRGVRAGWVRGSDVHGEGYLGDVCFSFFRASIGVSKLIMRVRGGTSVGTGNLAHLGNVEV